MEENLENKNNTLFSLKELEAIKLDINHILTHVDLSNKHMEVRNSVIEKIEFLQQNNIENNTCYLVKYSGGSWDDFHIVTIFVTNNKSTAFNYCDKFNRILEKWKNYYANLDDELIDLHYDRYIRIEEINNCFYETIQIR